MIKLLYQGVENEIDATNLARKLRAPSFCLPSGEWVGHPCTPSAGDLDREDPKLQEECGVVAIHGHPDAARQAYLGLYALQHRGQESAGIATADGQRLANIKGMGLVSEIFTDDVLAKLPGTMAIGHTRYSTTGDSALLNAQPIRVDSTKGLIAIAHNGNLVNLGNIRARLERDGAYFQTTSDSEIIVQLIAHSKAGTLVDAIADSLSQVDGAFLDRDDDPRPHLCSPRSARLPSALHRPHQEPRRGQTPSSSPARPAPSICSAPSTSATCSPANSSWSRKTASPAASTPPASSRPAASSSTSTSPGPTAASSAAGCRRAATRWAASWPANPACLPTSSFPCPTPALPQRSATRKRAAFRFRLGLIRNHYVGRTFIEPEQRVRDFGVRLKLNPVHNLLEGKRVILIDDSIIRGTTSRKIVRMVRGAGAKEVHLRISCPPTISPCFYGVDTPSKRELIAANNSIEEIRRFIEADSLAYLSLEGLLKCCDGAEHNGYCTACYTGNYPTQWVDVEDILPAARHHLAHRRSLARDSTLNRML